MPYRSHRPRHDHRNVSVSYSPTRHSALALAQLRNSVAACCWVVGVALLIQIVTWSLSSFTDLRYQKIEATTAAAPPKVLSPEEVRRQAIHSSQDGPVALDRNATEVNRVFSRYDRYFMIQTDLASGLGILASVALLPLLALGVVLAAGASVPGVERTVSSFVWAIVVTMLVLPLGSFIEAMPFNGIFANYESMMREVEVFRAGDGGGVIFFGKYLLLPVACMAGIAAIGLRFRSATFAGLMPREDFRLDPELEKEVANTKATSLVGGGGRTAGAFTATLREEDEEPPRPKPKPQREEQPLRSLRSVSPGEAPRRPI